MTNLPPPPSGAAPTTPSSVHTLSAAQPLAPPTAPLTPPTAPVASATVAFAPPTPGPDIAPAPINAVRTDNAVPTPEAESAGPSLPAPVLPGTSVVDVLDGPAMVAQSPVAPIGTTASVATVPVPEIPAPEIESFAGAEFAADVDSDIADPTPTPTATATDIASPSTIVAEIEPDAEATPTQQPLSPLRPFRFLAFGLLSIAVPMLFVDSTVAAAVAVAGFVALVVWSMLAALNADRARPATAHSRAPRATRVLVAWLVAPILAVPGVLGLLHLHDAVESASEVERDAATLALTGAVFAFVVIGLIAVYMPYAKLGAASKWIGADATKFRRWFYAPLVTALLTLTGLVLYGLSGEENVADAPGVDALFAGVTRDGYGLILLIVLPSLVWILMGFRAMIDIEEATAHQYRRRGGDDSPSAAASAYLAAQGVPVASTDATD